MKKIINFLCLILLFGNISCTFVQNTASDISQGVSVFDQNLQPLKVCFIKSKSADEIRLVIVPRKVSKEDSIIAGAVR